MSLYYGKLNSDLTLPGQMVDLCHNVMTSAYTEDNDIVDCIRFLDNQVSLGTVNVMNNVVAMSQDDNSDVREGLLPNIERDHVESIKFYRLVRVGLWCAAFGVRHPGMKWDFETN